MESVLKLRLKVDGETERVLDGQSKIINWLYNHLLEKAEGLKEEFIRSQDPEAGKILYGKRGLRNLIPAIKKEAEFLKTVHSSPLKNAALRLSESIKRHQDGKKEKRRVIGWPRFRSWKQKFFSLLYDEPNKGWKVDGKKIKISLGSDKDGRRLYAYGELEKTLDQFKGREIRNLRITKDHGVFYCVFTVKSPVAVKKNVEKIIALDPNHKNLAYGVASDGKAFEIQNPYFHKTLSKRIDQLKSRRDHCKKRSKKLETSGGKIVWLPSRRYTYFQSKIENLLRIRRDQTKTYLYTVSNWLCKKYDLISVGDYTPKGGGINRGMRRAMNNESLIGRFKNTIGWVCCKSGKQYEEWPEYGSTRTCHSCGYVKKDGLSPDKRHWQCDGCGRSHYRDENAAWNGLQRTMEKLRFPGSGHLLSSIEISEDNRWALRYDGLGLQRRLHPGVNV